MSPAPKEWLVKVTPSADGSFCFLGRAQEATELLPADLLQVRCGRAGRRVPACAWVWDLPHSCLRFVLPAHPSSGAGICPCARGQLQDHSRLLLRERASPAAHRGMNPDQEPYSLFAGPGMICAAAGCCVGHSHQSWVLGKRWPWEAQPTVGKRASPFPPFCPQIEQRIEPAKRAAHSVSKRLQACLQGQCGSEMDKRVVSSILHLSPHFP